MVKTYIFLFGAIFCEVAGTMLLPVSQNFTKICQHCVQIWSKFDSNSIQFDGVLIQIRSNSMEFNSERMRKR